MMFFSLINSIHVPRSTYQKIRTMLENVSANFAIASFFTGFVQLPMK